VNDVEVAVTAAAKGAAVVRRCCGTKLDRVDKGAGDFATNADIEAESEILELLHAARPDDAVLAEESGRSGARDGSRTWLVDPLCGTLNYAVAMRVVGVNVALTCDDRVMAAAVADPFSKEIFWSDGRSAFVRTGDRERRLEPSGRSSLVDLNFDPPFPSAPGFRAVSLAADSRFAARFRPRVVSSSLALTWVATGQRAGYVTDGDLRDSVHFAAGLAICEAAGCRLTDLRGEPWGTGATGLIAGADAATHEALLSLVREPS